MKRLSLKAERLAELTDDELRGAVGGTYSASTCMFSIDPPCISIYYTHFDLDCVVHG